MFQVTVGVLIALVDVSGESWRFNRVLVNVFWPTFCRPFRLTFSQLFWSTIVDILVRLSVDL
jgi:hypothetical protein